MTSSNLITKLKSLYYYYDSLRTKLTTKTEADAKIHNGNTITQGR
jgi:hypothetical protein